MTATQVGYRLHEWGHDPVLEEFPIEQPGPQDVLVEVEACGVGLTVLNWSKGDVSNDPGLLPRVPGHEIIGKVTDVGSPGLEELAGKRVTFHAYLFCGACPECIAGYEPGCSNLAGLIGLHRDGGYAPMASLPGRNAVVLPESLDPVAATVVPDAVSTAVHVARSRASISTEDRVVVIGAGGGVGIHMIQVIATYGARVVGFDIGQKKLEAIEQMGFTSIDSEHIHEITPGSLWSQSPTVVVDLVGHPSTLQWAQSVLGFGGRHIVLTTFRDHEMVIDPRSLVLNETAVFGSRSATLDEYRIAAALVDGGRVAPVIGHVANPAELMSIHRSLEQGALVGRGALVWGSRL